MKLLLLLLLLPTMAFAQQTYVPDDNFEQALIDLEYDEGPLDDYVPTASIDTVTQLVMKSKFIEDLTGIEDFAELRLLNCQGNDLIELDLSSNTNLNYLNCWANILETMDLSMNPYLSYLDCSLNNLAELDLSKNTFLTILNCSENPLGELDLRANVILEDLNCAENELAELDLSKNRNLKELKLYKNALKAIGLNSLSKLTHLDCSDNQLNALDLTYNGNLELLICSDNSLAVLKMDNVKKLTGMMCSNNGLSVITVSRNPDLVELECSSNEIEILDLSINLKLRHLDCSSNPFLDCIQVNDSLLSIYFPIWKKDDHAVWSDDCGYTGVEADILATAAISVFPNPARESFVVDFELESPQSVKLFLSDLSGNKLQEFMFANILNVNKEFDVSKLPSGVYFLNVGIGNESLARKIIVE